MSMMDILEEIRLDPERGAARLEREYGAKLLVVAKGVCRDEQEARALVYDTMAAAVRQIGELSKSESFFSWMCSIMVRMHGAATRRMSNEKVVYTDELPEVPTERDGAAEIFESVDGALLRDAIADLPEKLLSRISSGDPSGTSFRA